MIARLLQALWCALGVAVIVAAAGSAHLFGNRIGAAFAALLGAVAVLALHPLAIVVNFVASRLVGDRVPPEHRLSVGRTIAMVAAEVVASGRGVWLANPFLSLRSAPVGRGDRPVAVLFVHGYFCNRAVWHPALRAAVARGYRCEAVTLPNPFASIDAQVDAVRRALADVSDGWRPVVIVGHSMGGLVARATIRAGVAVRVPHVVTLGAPHRGTWTARFGRAPALAQMALDNAWLATLSDDEDRGRGLPRARLTSIWSVHDDIVYPQSTSILDGAENVAIGGRGHVALLYDPDVRRLIFDRLDAVPRAMADAS